MDKKEDMVIGCGRFGRTVATTLSELGNEVLVIDQDEGVINTIANDVTHAVVGDIMEEGLLESLGIHNFDTCIIAMGSNFEATLLATTIAKENEVPIVIAKVKDKTHGKIINKVGADRFIIPEKDSGIRLAHNLDSTNIFDYIEISDDYEIVERKVPQGWLGQSIEKLNVRSSFGITIISVKNSETKEVLINPDPQYVFKETDVVIILGNLKSIESLA